MQVKRIHEYKRQLMLALYIIILYNRLIDDPDYDMVPRTFIFAGKAAPGYAIAKKIISLINHVAEAVNSNDRLNDKLKVVFLPDYRVSLAERIMPAMYSFSLPTFFMRAAVTNMIANCAMVAELDSQLY